jgi:hypothetical protein
MKFETIIILGGFTLMNLGITLTLLWDEPSNKLFLAGYGAFMFGFGARLAHWLKPE